MTYGLSSKSQVSPVLPTVGSQVSYEERNGIDRRRSGRSYLVEPCVKAIVQLQQVSNEFKTEFIASQIQISEKNRQIGRVGRRCAFDKLDQFVRLTDAVSQVDILRDHMVIVGVQMRVVHVDNMSVDENLAQAD